MYTVMTLSRAAPCKLSGPYCLVLQPLHHLALANFVPVSAQIQLCPSEVAVRLSHLWSSLLDFAHAVVLT